MKHLLSNSQNNCSQKPSPAPPSLAFTPLPPGKKYIFKNKKINVILTGIIHPAISHWTQNPGQSWMIAIWEKTNMS